MYASAPPPRMTSEDRAAIATRLGTAAGLGLMAAIAGTFPAALRVSSSVPSEGLMRAWIALSAAAVVPMFVAIVVLRGARDGLRAFGGEGAGVRAFGAALWLALLTVSLSFYGATLRATTHHHALAGVTFAAGAVVLAVATALVCARVVTVLRAVSPSTRSMLAVVIGGSAALAVAWTGIRFIGAVAHDPGSTTAGGTVVDVLAFCLVALFAARPSLATQRPLALAGPPVAVFLLAAGLTTLRDPELRGAIDERAPAFSPVADLAGSP